MEKKKAESLWTDVVQTAIAYKSQKARKSSMEMEIEAGVFFYVISAYWMCGNFALSSTNFLNSG
jgi:hypothetical protein